MTWFLDGTKLLVSGMATVGHETEGIWVVSTVTGTLRQLREHGLWGAAISPDGSRIAFGNREGDEIWLMGANGEEAGRLLTLEKGYWLQRLAWFPEGQRLAYGKSSRGLNAIESLDLKAGRTTLILSDRRLLDFCLAPDGHILYALSELPPNEYDSNLWALRTDLRTGKASSKPRQITNWAGFAFWDLSLTADGKRLAFVNWRNQSDVYVGELETNGTRLSNAQRLTADDRFDWPGGWTRDSKSFLFYSDRNGKLDLFNEGVKDRTARAILVDREDKRFPQLSPDGSWILYLAWPKTESGAPPAAGRLMRFPVSGGPPQVVLNVRGYPTYPSSYPSFAFSTITGHPDFRCASPPATSCILSEVYQNQLVFSTFDPVEGRKVELTRIDMGPEDAFFWDLSPDGSRIAFGKMDRRSGHISILQLGSGTTQEISVRGWTNLSSLAWSVDGKSWFVIRMSTRGSSLLRVTFNGEARLLREVAGWLVRPLPSPDGRYLAFGEVSLNSNAWMIENLAME